MYPVDVNYLATLVAAVVPFLFGAVWYGPVMGKAWMTAHGFTEQELKEASQNMGRTYGLSFLAYLVMAVVLSILVHHLQPAGIGQGLWLGAIVWAGFMMPVTLTSVLFSRSDFSLFWIDSGFQVLSALAMAAIIPAWA